MSETRRLLQTLKQVLREEGITYAQVGRQLGLSEPSIKRLFSSGGLSLERLEQICGLVKMELGDLVVRMSRERHRVDRLAWEQEEELVADRQLLLVAICVRDGMGLNDILAQYPLQETQVIHQLARLDRLKLIELLPGNRVRLLISRDFHWIPNGPIESFFRGHVQPNFLSGDFQGKLERRRYLYGRLTPAAQAQLVRRIDALILEFTEQHTEGLQHPPDERTMVGLLVAMRPSETLLQTA